MVLAPPPFAKTFDSPREKKSRALPCGTVLYVSSSFLPPSLPSFLPSPCIIPSSHFFYVLLPQNRFHIRLNDFSSPTTFLPDTTVCSGLLRVPLCSDRCLPRAASRSRRSTGTTSGSIWTPKESPWPSHGFLLREETCSRDGQTRFPDLRHGSR